MEEVAHCGDFKSDIPEAMSPDGRRKKIIEILSSSFDGELPDVIFSHGAGIKKDERTNTYRTLSFGDLSEHGLATGSRTRVIATAEIAKNLPDLKIVTTSFNRFDSDEPTMATVIREELKKRGVNDENVILEEESFSTTTQVVEAIRLAVKNHWTKIVNITNTYHVPRMKGLYKNLGTIIIDEEFQDILKEFHDSGGKMEFVSAEDIMRLINSKYATYLSEVEKTPAYTAMVEAERRGLEDLEAGRYRVVLKPESER